MTGTRFAVKPFIWLLLDFFFPPVQTGNLLTAGSNSKVLALPAPSLDPKQRVAVIESNLGLHLMMAGSGDWAVTRPLATSARDPLMIGVSEKPLDLFALMANSRTPFLIALNRAVPVDPTAFEQALCAAEKGQEGNAPYLGFLASVRSWATPRPGKPLLARQLALWAPAELCREEDEASSPLANTDLMPFRRYGSFMRALMQRRAQPLVEIGGEHPLLANPPERLALRDGWVEFGGRCFGFWAICGPTAGKLAELQSLDLDLLAFYENVEGRLFASYFARVGADSPSGLAEMDKILSAYARTQRLWGYALNGSTTAQAFRFFVPGGQLPKHQEPDQLDAAEAGQAMDAFTRKVDMSGAAAGDMFLGVSRNGLPVYFNRASRSSAVFLGQSKSGKTTYASFLALSSTPHVLLIHMSSVEGEASVGWGKSLGGQVLDLDLPGSTDLDQELKLIAEDKAWVGDFWTRLEVQWLSRGEAYGLPIILRRNSGDEVRFAALADAFALGFLKAWRAFNKRTGQPAVVVWDDLAGVPGLAKSPFLGDLPSQIGMGLKAKIRECVDTGSKLGVQTFLTVHDRKEFAEWPAGIWGSLGLALEFPADVQYKEAYVLDPRLAPLDAAEYVRLTESGRKYLGQLCVVNRRLPLSIEKMLSRRPDFAAYGS